jgi:hypothetical protein
MDKSALTYEMMRRHARIGDTIACDRKGLMSWGIKLFTLSKYNHTAVIYVSDDHDSVWVAEMLQGKGLLWTPASDWIRDKLNRGIGLRYCFRPTGTNDEESMTEFMIKSRASNLKYGWGSLFKILAGQVLRLRYNTASLVCSTFAQSIHEIGGYQGYSVLADPDDIQEHSQITFKIKKAKND